MKIGIVGSGPSGIILACLLSESLPDAKIYIHEASKRVCGACESVRVGGAVREMGTCLTTLNYVPLILLALKLNVPMARVTIPLATEPGNAPYVPSFPDVFSLLRIFAEGVRWSALAKSLFDASTIAPDVPLPLASLEAARYSETLADFLGTTSTTPALAILQHGQLYGSTGEVTLHTALQWIKPTVALAPAPCQLAWCFPKGFQNLFETLLAKSGATVLLNDRVENSETLRTQRGYDEVFVTAPLDEIQSPCRYLFERRALVSNYTVSVQIWVPKWCWPGVYFFYPEGVLCSFGLSFSTDIVENSHKEILVWALLSYPSSHSWPENASSDVLRALRVLDKSWADLGEDKIEKMVITRYGLRYAPEHLRAGVPQEIARIQGLENIWYAGGCTSHWDVSNIFMYNVRLVQRFLRDRVGDPLAAAFLPFKYACFSDI